jgi:hypothetical protein
MIVEFAFILLFVLVVFQYNRYRHLEAHLQKTILQMNENFKTLEKAVNDPYADFDNTKELY